MRCCRLAELFERIQGWGGIGGRIEQDDPRFANADNIAGRQCLLLNTLRIDVGSVGALQIMNLPDLFNALDDGMKSAGFEVGQNQGITFVAPDGDGRIIQRQAIQRP